MIRWTCSIQIADMFACNKFRKRLATGDVSIMLKQNRLRLCEHVSIKDSYV